MALKTLVKVSGINNLSDARYCAGMGATLLGFPVGDGDGHLLPAEFEALTQWVKGVGLVGELDAIDQEGMQRVLTDYALDYLQVRYPVAPDVLADVNLPLLLQVRLEGDETVASLSTLLAPYVPYVQYFLVEVTTAAVTSDLAPMVHQLAVRFPILQGFGVVPEYLPQLLGTPIKGLALQGGMELRPGYKDYEELAMVLEGLTVG